MSDGVNDPHQEALGELALAALALDEHDEEHAVRHLSAALAYEPTLPEAHELLEKIAAHADDGGLTLFHPGERATVGRVAAFAHVLARHGRHADALSLLAQATVHDPARPWADVSWVQALDAGRVGVDHLLRVLLSVLGALPDPAHGPVARACRPYLDLARRSLTAYPDEALLHGAASGIARRLREVPLALAWAERGVRLQSNKLTEMWWGNALRAAGRLDEAVRAMRAARRHDPADLSVASDLALWLTELGHTAEALALIEQAMASDPSYDCAVHTAHRLRFLADGDPDHLVALADFMRATTDASHEHFDLQQCCDRLPWLGFVPEAGDPIATAGPTPDPPHPTSARALAAMLPLGWGPPPMAYDAAVRLAGVPVDDLLAALAHPPVPAGTDPDRVPAARRGLRLWACLGLLHHDASQPWFTSNRRRLLLDLALGAGEGPVEALYALVTAAWVDPGCRADVAALLEARLRAVPEARRRHPFTADVAVAQLAFVTPGMPAAARALAREITGDTPPAPSPAAPLPQPRRPWLSRLLRRP
ncbi:tetratricopeptide repeat protein [Catellatospora sp. NPDC049609]|uniref:tetratricopeptide repeat protein n=1 Tax=Catellatospora sp. NPDC049609 TaxID=3155505 RepID=UPI0034151B0D